MEPLSSTNDRHLRLSLIRDDQLRRWNQGQRIIVEEYLENHPALKQTPDAVLDLIHAEILLRQKESETPTLEEYLRRFPDLERNLRQLWPLIQDTAGRVLPSGNVTEGTTDSLMGISSAVESPFSLPGYELLNPLGRGGMGIVFLARQRDLDRLVAIKFIRTGPFAHPEELQRFRTEAIAVGRLRQQGVVQVHTFGDQEGCLYLVMEFVRGGSLAQRLKKGLMPIPSAVNLIKQLAVALQSAHDANIVHRDLKPGNVLLDENDQPKISDFGLARLMDSDNGQTISGMVIGTPSYMSPEQARGDLREIGPQADIWSLGVILYECLTHQLPFRTPSRGETLHRVQYIEPQSPRSIRSEIDGYLESICLKCLKKAKTDRYLSAGQLAEDLTRWLAGERWPDKKKTPQRFLIGLACVSALILALFLLSQMDWRRTEQRMAADLHLGIPITLISDKDCQVVPQWVLGKETGSISRATDGSWLLQTSGFAMMQLWRKVDVKRFRFKADIRHERSFNAGIVGLYFGHQQLPSTDGIIQLYQKVTYNDIIDERKVYDDIVAAMAKPLPADMPPRPNFNLLQLDAVINGAKGWKEGPRKDITVASGDGFKASGEDNPTWRTVIVDVNEDRITVFRTDLSQFVTEQKYTTIRDRVKEHLRQMQPLKKELNREPVSPLDGGAGLIVERGSASFRNVILDPY